MDDIFLGYKEVKRLVGVLKGIRFEDFEVHPHYFKDGNPRRGISLDKAKEIYYHFDRIMLVFVREGEKSFKYNFVYKISKNEGYILILLLDERPRKLFNIISKGPNIDLKFFRKHVRSSR